MSSKLVFREHDHTYWLGDKQIPSVSTILAKTIFKDKYKDIDTNVLENAAQFGTAVHYAVETGNTFHLTDLEFTVYYRYLKLVERIGLKPLEHEKRVHYQDLYAGTFDMIAEVDNKLVLCDVKTTYELDLEYIGWQLSLYELAYGKRFDGLYAIWTPKRKSAEFREVKRKSLMELGALLTEFYGKDIWLLESEFIDE